ncbi:MAG: phosphoenolpyruvate synthase [Candidatus Aenigmarchaeota archaeon]|nr:phosphoenolpyruvate synthase [Candidatus Aenigmarchaeota archaeon]
MQLVKFFDSLSMKDVALVGGKNASLGEMICATKVPVPYGFAITSEAYKYFIKYNKLSSEIRKILKNTNVKKVTQLKKSGKAIRSLIENGKFPDDLEKLILKSFDKLKSDKVAVRSSATAEDLPDASFAGQQESYLNISKDNLLLHVKKCFASLFTDRAISYREDKKFDHFKVYLSVGIQQLIKSDVSGVMFTLEPDSGHRSFVFINGSWGLGDYIVQGKTNPDKFIVHKDTLTLISKKLGRKERMEIRTKKGVKGISVPKNLQKKFVLNDKEVLQLVKYGLAIEKHYKRPMDIEWCKASGKLWIVQSRPVTVNVKKSEYVEYQVSTGKIIAKGSSIGRSVAQGKVCVIKNIKEMKKFKKGQILVTKQTDPDWEPLMKLASGIITEVGGTTSHCAIVSRELGIPAIVGVDNATHVLKNNQKITLDCTNEIGNILSGSIKFSKRVHDVSKVQKTNTKILVNIGNPDLAFDLSQMPVDGVGLARQEFIISSYIGEHPLKMIKEHREKEYIEKLAEGIAKICSAFYSRKVVVRLSDFKTDEYRSLIGGEKYEPIESNPMIGWRGSSRYIDKEYEDAFKLECSALRRVFYDMKLTNLVIMVPFCRTISEAVCVVNLLKKFGLGNIPRYVMAEIPSNIILEHEFSKYFSGFSIGSNDLTQLTLGIDRNNEKLAKEFDERNEAVKVLISTLIKNAHKDGKTVSICGEAPSNYPEFVAFLVKNKIDAISVEHDSIIKTKLLVAKIEKK